MTTPPFAVPARKLPQITSLLTYPCTVCGIAGVLAASTLFGPPELWYTQEIGGQIAQLVERSPEKAGVGGSTPSLATTSPKSFDGFLTDLADQPQRSLRRG